MRILRAFLAALAVLAAPCALCAAYTFVGSLGMDGFDESAKAWRPMTVEADYQPRPEALRLRIRGAAPGRHLRLRLELERLPHYSEWLAARQNEGGAAWFALRTLLDQVAGRTVAVMTADKLPEMGACDVVVGLRRGHRFQSYAQVRGSARFQAGRLIFSPESVAFDDAQTALAWSLFLPLARKQALRAAGQTTP